MGAFIARQPNGLLCRHSSVVDCITHYNLTEEDYIELCAERARMEAKENLRRKSFVKPYEWVLENFIPNNMSNEEFLRLRKEMGEEI